MEPALFQEVQVRLAAAASGETGPRGKASAQCPESADRDQRLGVAIGLIY